MVKKTSTTRKTPKRGSPKAKTTKRAHALKATKPRRKTAKPRRIRPTKPKKRSAIQSTRNNNRDNFPMPVLKHIAQEVGYRCSNPDCDAPTIGPSRQKGVSNVGVGGHITAAAPAGPRYDAKLTPAERRSESNAIWLCNTCGRLVDNDDATYTIAQLMQWKRDAIDGAQKALASGGRSTAQGLAAAQLELQKEALAHQKQTHEAQMRARELATFRDMYSAFLQEASAYADAIDAYSKQMFVAGYQPDRPTRAAMRKPIETAFGAMERALRPILLADSDETRRTLRWELIRRRTFEPPVDTIQNQKTFAEKIHHDVLGLLDGITRLQDNVGEALGHQPQQRSEANLAFMEKMLADSKAKADTVNADMRMQLESLMREHQARKASADTPMPSDNPVRVRVWNVLHVMIFEDDASDEVATRRGDLTLTFLREIWSEVLSRPIDEVPGDFVVAWRVFRQVLMTCAEELFYGIVRYAGTEKDIRAKLAEALKRGNAPYRFIGDKLQSTGDGPELAE